jgi:serine/threonine protein kinase
MTGERWARIRDVFVEAVELPSAERAAFLDHAGEGDPDLRTEVNKLLAAADKELESPVPDLVLAGLSQQLWEGCFIGRYRVEGLIGKGGMGEIYRAVDPELARPVAIKVLPTSVDAALRSRFTREARAASAINHPNVVRIYDVGEDRDLAFIAMEWIDGRPLDQVIPNGGLPLSVALAHASSIASGLADAHARGIVHRDLKPTNIMITLNGEVKLLDFGLAKRVDLGARGEELTLRGEILGTPAYMSPEQAEGKDVDSRSDIFSFGSTLYQMLSGHRAFDGDSAVAILGAILREEPKPVPWLPKDVQTVLSRCLQKDPSNRFQHMGDVRLMIEEARRSLSQKSRRPRQWLLIAALGIAAGTAIVLLTHPTFSVRPALVEFTPFVTDAVGASAPAWSPDGKSIAYLALVDGIDQVFVRNTGSSEAAVITTSDRSCGPPFWSADGTRIFYNLGDDLWSSGLAGGEPRLELRDAREASRSPDGKMLAFLRGNMGFESLWIKSGEAEEPWQYVRDPFPRTFVKAYQPTFFVDGSGIGLVVDRETGGGTGEFWRLPLGRGEPYRVPTRLPASAWLHFSWWRDPGSVLMARSDPGHLHLELMNLKTGIIEPLTTGTGQESEPELSPDSRTIAFTSGRTDMDLFEVAIDGSNLQPLLATTLDEQSGAFLPSGAEYAYVTNQRGTPEVWLRRRAEIWARPILASRADGVPPWYLLYCLRASPDGQHVSYDVLSSRHWIWISSIAGGRPTPLDTESTDQHAASWSPDGKRIAYRRLNKGAFELATVALGGGPAQVLGDTGPGGHMRGGVTDWSPTGEWICHDSLAGLELVSPDGSKRRLLNRERYTMFAFSRDGKSVIVLRRSMRRHWELASLSVEDGACQKVSVLPVSPDVSFGEITRHPDGKRLLVSVGTPRRTIWLMRGF